MTTSSLPSRSFFRLPDPSLFSEPSVWVLIAVNLLPLVGVLFFDWDLFSLMVLYWMETAMIGFFQLIKILVTSPILAIFLIPFFTFHFGMFMYVHFIFLSSFFGPPWVKALRDSVPAILERLLFQEGFWIPALALFLSHGVSFFMHGLNPSTSAVTPARPVDPAVTNTLSPAQQKMVSLLTRSAGNMNKDLMAEPYKRVVIMHLTIIFGGILAMALKTTKAAMVIMILLKIGADLFSHANYHGLGDPSKPQEGA